MKKIVSSLLLALFIFPACAFAQTPAVIARTAESIVTVSWDKGEEGSRCTGFIVGIKWVLTAEHCLAPKDSNVDMYVEGKIARVLKRNDAFALLEFDSENRRILEIRKTPLKLGESVASFGFAWGEPLHVFKRAVAFIAPESGHVILDGVIAPGMSGGPVIDENGQVVGLNQAANGVVSILCGQQEIREFIK